ncbi:hypothetical protein MMC22_006235 [Lobaria immixta]|nr:hypothetical protein [Lobaria immixta]
MPHLPYEIWYMICTQLCNQRDSITLFNCACSGKQLATIALTNLYRMRHLAPVTDCRGDGEPPADDELGGMKYAARLAEEKRVLKRKLSSWDQYVKQWAVLWRTIILSSQGKTLYPYAQYIRTLDLRDLELLLTDIWFEGRTRE